MYKVLNIKWVNFLSKKITSDILIILIILTLITLTLFRLYPFENSLNIIVVGYDDWNRYARFGLEIKNNGILIQSENGIYQGPGGFLYNYFIALCFWLFGENTIPIFIIQSILLGFSIAFIYWAFSDKMKPLTGFIFLITMFVFALFDVYKYYTFQFLSENLAIFTISFFIYCLIKGIEKNNFILQIIASIFLTLSILTRPNIFPFGILTIIILIFYFFKLNKSQKYKAILFIFIISIGISAIAVRNYIICRSWSFLPALGVYDSFHQTDDVSILYFLKKTIFCFGVLTPLEPSYNIRYHWIIMWIGYFIYIYLKVKSNSKFETWEVLVQVFIILYYLLSIIFVQVGSYGFRAFIPITFIVLAFSFLSLENLLIHKSNKFN